MKKQGNLFDFGAPSLGHRPIESSGFGPSNEGEKQEESAGELLAKASNQGTGKLPGGTPKNMCNQCGRMREDIETYGWDGCGGRMYIFRLCPSCVPKVKGAYKWKNDRA